ncbi:MAG: VCBS repeat-containing protein, partial [Acidobacteria bacterium]|nr:VCBS repeat-containing protein [Acidobacteriota bacterium]
GLRSTTTQAYARVAVDGPWPGIDLVHYGTGGALEHDFLVAPGADPSQIRLRLEGGDGERPQLQADGALGLRTGNGLFRLERPVAYQDLASGRVPVPASYRLSPSGVVTIATAGHDPAYPLVIDPILRFSGFVGGNDRDTVNAVAVDRDGAVVLTGYTASADFPAGPSGGPSSDAFVTKLTGDGSALVYTTILSSTFNDAGNSVAVDPWGNAVVVGRSSSAGFPIAGGPLNGGTYGGSGDGFIARIAPGGGLLYSAYIGGTGSDEALGVAVDFVGDAYVVGATSSADFVTVAGSHDLTLGGPGDAFLTKVRMLPGQNYVYSTYLGGAGTDQAYGVALAPGGRAPFVTGGTDGSFPVTTGQTVYGGGLSDAFVASFGSGGALLAATYYGGSGTDQGLAITLGRQGDPRVVGYTTSADLPLASAVQSTLGGSQDAFVLSLPPGLAGRFIATYFGGTGFDEASAVATDPSNGIVFAGSTDGLTPTADAIQTTFGGGLTDAFLAIIGYPAGGGIQGPSGIAPVVLHATYLGGTGDDTALALAIDPQRHTILAGETRSPNFPSTPGVFDATCGSDGLCNGIWDGFVTKIGASRPCPNTSFTGPDAVGISHPPLSAIAAGDLGTPDGFDDLVVTTQQSGSPGVIALENSTVATFSGLFSSVPGGASSVALGDLNGDGRLDLVVGRDGSGQYRSYSYQNGGPFTQLSEGPLRAGVSSLALGDVNGDGVLDLVYGHNAGYTVALGDGTGGFSGAPFDRTTSAPPGKVGFVDSNQDGRLDIVAVLPGLDLIEVALGLGSGLFSAPTGIATAAGDQPRTFATGDLDRDGWTDLLVGNLGAATQVTVYLSDQTGSFVAGTQVTGLPAGVTGLVITDFHRDDLLDFNAVSTSTDRVWGCRGDGAGGFPGCGFKVQSYGLPAGIAAGDFNGDGTLEFAIASADGDVRTEKNACASIAITPPAFTIGVGMASGTATLSMDPAPLAPVTFDLHYPPAAMGQSQFSGPAQVTIAKDQTSVTFSLNGDVAGAASLLIAEAPASPFLSILAGANVTVGTPPSADLGITLTDSPDPVLIGGNLTYTATVTNAGPDTATSVVVTNAYPAGLVLLSAVPSQGTCTPAGAHVSCALGSIANAGTATVTLVYTVGGSPRVVTNTVTVTSAVADPVSGNDSATTTTNASAPPSANLGVTLTDSPDPVLVGGSITYTATITNAGPDTATGVTLTQLKPAGATLVSAISSQGACTPVPASVTCALGPIANAASATLTMVYTADGPTGSVVDTSTVASGVADPVSGNDSATATTTVSAPAASGAFRVIAGNPLTINVGADAAFQVFNVTVPGQGQIYPSGTSTLADMGVFVRRSGTLFAPDFSIHSDGTATSSIGAYTAWVPVSISNVTGAGTAVSPYQVVVVCDAGTTGLRLTMTVNYVNGDSFFTKTMSFSSASQTAFDAFLGSDFYLANDDSGVPFLEPTSTSPGGQDCGPTPTYTILHIPLTPAQKYSARGYSTVWSEIGAGTLSNVVDAGCRDNGAALQWQSLTAGPSGPAIVDAATSFGAIPSIARFRVDAVTPAQGAPGQSLTVSVTGIGFQAGTQFAFGADITAQAPTILSPTSANVAISIAPGAALGFRDVLGTQSPGGLTSTLTNGFEVTGGGAVAPDLALSKSHGGNFSPGGTGTFTLTATNLGNGPTTGPVTIVDTLPAGLTFVSAAGP